MLAGQRIDIYFVLDADRVTSDQVARLLAAIGASGFGRDASTGLGKFTVEPPSVAASFATSGAANACWTLAPAHRKARALTMHRAIGACSPALAATATRTRWPATPSKLLS